MKKTQQKRDVATPQEHGVDGASVDLQVERLRRQFEKFRRDHLPRTRIPDTLRAAALSVLDHGAPELDVRRACKATTVQLTQWRGQLRHLSPMIAPTERLARVFDVVDEEPEIDTAEGCEPPGPELELRLGGWAIRIRSLEA